jgi:hypothetical protein
MLRLHAALITGLLALTSWSFSAIAADLFAHRAHTQKTYMYGATPRYGRGCSDGYSCYPLYGAYGPYGGVAYWSAYSYGGWDSAPFK